MEEGKSARFSTPHDLALLAANALALLRPRRERPSGRTAEKRDEVASSQV
jgi:hypothetical protein